MIFIKYLLLLLKTTAFFVICLSSLVAYGIPAFPGAEGFGATSAGGRGGKVIYVTNLKDSGTGSLRAAVESSGARTVIFRVGGTIMLKRTLTISNSRITIAGQTAPGDGITLRLAKSSTDEAVRIAAQDVIIRHIRVRVGPASVGECCRDAFTFINGTNRAILDHVSTSWATDETINAWYTAKNITVQHSILSEALRWGSHAEDGQFQKHSMGVLWGSDVKNISFHHNLMAHNDLRNPRITANVSSVFDVVNNVTYNRGAFGAEFIGGGKRGKDDIKINYIGNFSKAGASTKTSRYEIGIGSGSATKVYAKDNIGQGRANKNANEWAIAGSSTNFTKPAPTSFRSNKRFNGATYAISIDPVNTVMNKVLANVGATLPKQDAIDRRIIKDVKNGTGDIIDDPSEVGGWLSLSGGTPYSDNDRDGMSNGWEDNNNLNKNDASDGIKDKDGDGYTNLEEFLHCQAGDSLKCNSNNISVASTSNKTPSPVSIQSVQPKLSELQSDGNKWLLQYWRIENVGSEGWLRTKNCSSSDQVALTQVSKEYTGDCTMYHFERTQEDYVRIINRISGSYFMPLACSTQGNESAKIIQMSPENAPGWCSQWKLNRNKNGLYRLQNRKTKQYMRVDGCSKRNDDSTTIRQVDTSYNGNCTLWRFVKTNVDLESSELLEDANYRITDKLNGFYMHANSTLEHAAVSSKEYNEAWWSQRWKIEKVKDSDNMYRIKNLWSKKYLTAPTNGDWSKINLQSLNTGWRSQKWIIKKSGNGYSIQNFWTNYFLFAAQSETKSYLQSNDDNSYSFDFLFEKI